MPPESAPHSPGPQPEADLTIRFDREARPEPQVPLDEVLDYLGQPAAVAEQLAAHHEAGEDLGPVLEELRMLRQPGNHHRDGHPETQQGDAVVVNLLMDGHDELAKAMISSSTHEAENITAVAGRYARSPEEAQMLIEQAARLSTERRADLSRRLGADGADPALIHRIVDNATDPDSALDIAPQAWPVLSAAPDNVQHQLVAAPAPMPEVAKGIHALADHGIDNPDVWLLKRVINEKPGRRDTFLQSLSAAAARLEELQQSGRLEGPDDEVTALRHFADPAAAVQLAEDLTRENEMVSVSALTELVVLSPDKLPVEITAEQHHALVELRGVPELDTDTDTFAFYARRAVSEEHPQAASLWLRSALAAAEPFIKAQPSVIDQLPYAKNLADLSKALETAAPLAEAEPEEAARFSYMITGDEDPTLAARRLTLVKPLLDQYGLAWGRYDQKFLVQKFYQDDDEYLETMDTLLSSEAIRDELKLSYTSVLTGQSGDVALDDLPVMKTKLDEAGLSPEQAAKAFETWNTFDPLHRFESEGGELTEAALTKITLEYSEAMYRRMTHLTSFADKYGQDELQMTIDTFGIYNFQRHKADRLARQNQRWRDGETPAKNVVVSTREDWNGVFDYNQVQGDFDAKAAFYFEAESGPDIGRIAVQVGRREAEHGREPDIDNFIIQAHGSPEGVSLGPDMQALTIADYEAAAYPRAHNPRLRIQDYRRHLGNRFRVILVACSTSAPNGEGASFAEVISQGHDVQVDGPDRPVPPDVFIDEAGEVQYFYDGKWERGVSNKPSGS
jgi:hypothetical protein